MRAVIRRFVTEGLHGASLASNQLLRLQRGSVVLIISQLASTVLHHSRGPVCSGLSAEQDRGLHVKILLVAFAVQPG